MSYNINDCVWNKNIIKINKFIDTALTFDIFIQIYKHDNNNSNDNIPVE